MSQSGPSGSVDVSVPARQVSEATITSVEQQSASNLVGAIGSAADISVRCPVTLAEVQTAIQNYGKAAERFEFAKANVIAEQFRAANLAVTSTPQEVAWDKLLSALAEIADCDNKYYPLSFLVHKNRSMFRKESGGLKQAYANVAEKLQRGVDEVGSDSAVGGHLLSQCREYVMARVKMIEFYESMTLLESMSVISWSSMEQRAMSLWTDLAACHHPDLAPISHLFQEEIDILRLLIEAQIHISNCQMFESLLKLKEVRERFDFWIKEIGSLNDKSISFFARLRGAEPTPRNRLILWLIKFYDLLMAKFSLYFTNVLGQFCSDEDLKSIHSIDNTYNFIDGFCDFRKRMGASLVGIIMDRSKDNSEFHGFGYYRPDNRFTPGDSMEPLQGHSAKYPYVFKHQVVSTEVYRPSVAPPSELCRDDIADFMTMIHSNRVRTSSRDETIRGTRDRHALCRLDCRTDGEPRVVVGVHLEENLYIIAVFMGNTGGNDSKIEVAEFFRRMQNVLRGSALFGDLKNAAK